MIIECLQAIVAFVAMGFFAYMSSHLVSEQKAGKKLPLPWEKKE